MWSMRRSDRAMSMDDAWSLLRCLEVGRLGVISDGEPYVIPLNYAVIDDCIYFHSATTGRKIAAIQDSPRVCFLADEMIGIKKGQTACDFGTFYRSAVAWGEAVVVESTEEKLSALGALLLKYGGDPTETIPVEALESTAVVRIRVQALSAKQCLADT